MRLDGALELTPAGQDEQGNGVMAFRWRPWHPRWLAFVAGCASAATGLPRWHPRVWLYALRVVWVTWRRQAEG
jgi:hypothetical protein